MRNKLLLGLTMGFLATTAVMAGDAAPNAFAGMMDQGDDGSQNSSAVRPPEAQPLQLELPPLSNQDLQLSPKSQAGDLQDPQDPQDSQDEEGAGKADFVPASPSFGSQGGGTGANPFAGMMDQGEDPRDQELEALRVRVSELETKEKKATQDLQLAQNRSAQDLQQAQDAAARELQAEQDNARQARDAQAAAERDLAAQTQTVNALLQRINSFVSVFGPGVLDAQVLKTSKDPNLANFAYITRSALVAFYPTLNQRLATPAALQFAAPKIQQLMTAALAQETKGLLPLPQPVLQQLQQGVVLSRPQQQQPPQQTNVVREPVRSSSTATLTAGSGPRTNTTTRSSNPLYKGGQPTPLAATKKKDGE